MLSDHFGTEFFLTFSSYTVKNVQLNIVALVDTNVTISSLTLGVNRTIQIDATTGSAVDLPASLVQQADGKQEKGEKIVRVKADSYISISALNFVPNVSSDGYLAIPSSKLGKVYTFYCEYACIGSLVALHNNTNVTLTLSEYRNKSSFISLSQYQSYTFTYVHGSGIIKANHPIALRYGSVGACCISSNHYASLIEEAVEAYNSPLTFIVPSFANSTAQYVMCVSATYMENKTDVSINRQYTPYIFLKAAKYITTNQSASCTYYGNDFSTIIPPVKSYTNFYRFRTPSVTTFTHHAAIMVLTTRKYGIRVDNSPTKVPREETVRVDSTSYSVLYLNITAGQHDITHTKPSVNFGVILYGFAVGERGSYGYPGGMKIP